LLLEIFRIRQILLEEPKKGQRRVGYSIVLVSELIL
jgi:hypothetical protein